MFYRSDKHFVRGDRVLEKDGRHYGKVESVLNGVVKVRWLGNDWVSWLYPYELEHA